MSLPDGTIETPNKTILGRFVDLFAFWRKGNRSIATRNDQSQFNDQLTSAMLQEKGNLEKRTLEVLLTKSFSEGFRRAGQAPMENTTTNPSSIIPNMSSSESNSSESFKSLTSSPELFFPIPPPSMTDEEWEISKTNSGSGLLQEERFKLEEKARQEKAFSKENFLHTTSLILAAAKELREKANTGNSAGEGSDAGSKAENKGKKDTPQLAKLIARVEKYEKKVKEFNNDPNRQQFTKNYKKMHKDLLKSAKKDGFSKEDVKKALVGALEKNKNSWNEYKYTKMLHREDGTMFEVESTTTPQIDEDGSREGRRGRTSNDRKNTKHLVNRWISQVKVKANGGFEKILSIARHGCTDANEEAAKELIATALSSKIDVFSLGADKGTQENPIQFNLSNIQLMTPGILGDGDLPFKQMKTIKNLVEKEGPIELEVCRRKEDGSFEFKKVFVKVEKPLLFNFPCSWALFTFWPIRKFLKLNKNDEKNAEAMESLFGKELTTKGKDSSAANTLATFCTKENIEREWSPIDPQLTNCFPEGSIIGEYLKNEENSERDKKIVLQLAAQVIDMWRNDKHRKPTSNPYAIQPALAVLLDKVGYAVSMNCKSGKDRTGMVCAATETLAAEIAASGENPIIQDPYNMSLGHRINVSAMMTHSGSMEITRDNTGVLGIRINSSHPKAINVVTSGFPGDKIYGKVSFASTLAKS